MLERRVRRIVEPRIQEEQCGFRPGRGTVDQPLLEGAWEFAQPVHMCFVDLEKAFDHVPQGVLWGVLREYGVSDPLIWAVRSLCQSLVRIAGNKSDLFPVRVGLHQGCPFRALSGSGIRSCPKWRSSSTSGSCSRVRGGWSGRSTGGSVWRLQ